MDADPDVRRGDEAEPERRRLRCDGDRDADASDDGSCRDHGPGSSDVGRVAPWAHGLGSIAAQAVGS